MDISRENSSMYSNSSYVRHTTSYRQIIIVYNMTMLYNILVTKGLIGYQWIVRIDERKSLDLKSIFPSSTRVDETVDSSLSVLKWLKRCKGHVQAAFETLSNVSPRCASRTIGVTLYIYTYIGVGIFHKEGIRK